MDTVLNLPSTEGSSFRALLRKVGRALLEPTRFFRADFPASDTPSLLAFGIANAWAASAVAFFVQTINSLLLSQLLERWMQRMLASEDGFAVWGLSGKSFLVTSALTLLGPFLYLLRAVLGGFGLYLFARLLIEDRAGAPEPVTVTGAIRIRAAALTSEWYSLVPVFGGVLAFLASLVLTITGVRERFGVSTRRASAVVLAPYLLALFALVLFGALLLLTLSQIPYGDLLDLNPRDFGI
jgi:hypothetical protein